MNDKPASNQIDDIIAQYGGWKGDNIRKLRAIITNVDSDIVEEIKWKMANRPEGLPVWSNNGIICYIETWKDNQKLIFHKGAKLTDDNKLFNARLSSSTLRAIEIHEGDMIDEDGIKELVAEAIALNLSK